MCIRTGTTAHWIECWWITKRCSCCGKEKISCYCRKGNPDSSVVHYTNFVIKNFVSSTSSALCRQFSRVTFACNCNSYSASLKRRRVKSPPRVASRILQLVSLVEEETHFHKAYFESLCTARHRVRPNQKH